MRRRGGAQRRPNASEQNPTFCGRIESLIETFPDAKFVVLIRNPDETVPKSAQDAADQLDAATPRRAADRQSLRILAERSFHTYEHPLDVLTAHPETLGAWSTTCDLVAQPSETMRYVYDELRLDMPPALPAEIAVSREARARDHPPLQPRRVRARPAGDPGPASPVSSTTTAGTPKETRTCQLITARASSARRGTTLIAGLSRARDAIGSEAARSPPDDRVLAEELPLPAQVHVLGDRAGLSRGSGVPVLPGRHIQLVDKATIDNADALYLSAAVDGGERTYRIPRQGLLPKAPQYHLRDPRYYYADFKASRSSVD